MMRTKTTLLYVCFFVSGASALMYEIVWQRMLTLVFGVSSFSIAVVLSAFLAGLAIGARLFGRRADQSRHLVRLYAIIELSIAAAGTASIFFIPPLMRIFESLHALLEPGWLGSNMIRFVLAFVAIGIPSLLIGATVPVMARLVAERANSVAVGFGRFYTVNTVGSVAGAMAAGFLLIRTIGVGSTLYCAVGGNILAAAIALGISKSKKCPPAKIVVRSSETPHSHSRFAIVVAAVTGFTALAYEVAWLRLIAIYTLNSVYVFYDGSISLPGRIILRCRYSIENNEAREY